MARNPQALRKSISPILQRALVIWMAAFVFLSGCSNQDTASARNFVGKWHTSKLETPLYLYENGEWEIKTADGGILQYGVWEYKNKTIIWSYKVNGQIGHDANPVVMTAPRKFQVREGDQSITTFDKID